MAKNSISLDGTPLFLYCAVGRDYSTPTTRYIFSAGSDRQCVDVIILDDLIFELTEEFTGLLEGFVVDGMSQDIVQGVFLEPADTRVFIEDNDGKLALHKVFSVVFVILSFHLSICTSIPLCFLSISIDAHMLVFCLPKGKVFKVMGGQNIEG